MLLLFNNFSLCDKQLNMFCFFDFVYFRKFLYISDVFLFLFGAPSYCLCLPHTAGLQAGLYRLDTVRNTPTYHCCTRNAGLCIGPESMSSERPEKRYFTLQYVNVSVELHAGVLYHFDLPSNESVGRSKLLFLDLIPKPSWSALKPGGVCHI